jgi:hypothetical protein
MCDYCMPHALTADSLDYVDHKWAGRTDEIYLQVYYCGEMIVDATVNNDNISHKFKINYCPMCGRKLEG